MSNRFGGAAAFRSALLVTAATYISYAIGLIVSMVAARQLGPRDYGHYAYFVWLSGALTMLFCNGITLSAIRFISESLGRDNVAGANNINYMLRTWHVVSLAVVSLLFLLTFSWLLPAGWEKPGWVFAVAVLISGAAKSDYTIGTSISKGYGRFEVDAYTINLMSFAALAGVLIIAYLGLPIEYYIIYFVILSLGHSLSTRYLMRRAGISSSRGAIDKSLHDRIRNHHFWSAILFLVLAFSNKSVENVFLNSFVGPEAVGWFAIAAGVTRGGIDLLSSGLNTVLLPAMSHAFGSNDGDRVNRILTNALRIYFFLGVTLAGAGVLWAAPIITMLYGSEYSPAIIGLQVMMLVGALAMPEAATTSLLMTSDRQAVRVALAAAALLLTLVTAAALVPLFGFEGALGAHALARALIFATAVLIVTRTFKFALPYASLLRISAAAGIGVLFAGAVLLVSTSLPAQVIAGVAYVLGCTGASLPFGVWTKGDLKILSEFAERLPWLQIALGWIEKYARND